MATTSTYLNMTTLIEKFYIPRKSVQVFGIEIVPMTVTEFNFNEKWIIAKSMSYREKSNIQYWIIKNDFFDDPNVDLIKANTIGPLDSITFGNNLKEKNIDIRLRTIE